MIAYEPVWAIGTGRNARGADAAAMAEAIRGGLAGSAGASGADDVPVLYGGSVTAANIGEFLAEPSIDGALVGGASLKPDEMAGIVARAGVTADARRSESPIVVTDASVTDARRRAGQAPARPRPIVLVVLDGFGIGRDPGRRRDRRRTDADLARAPRALAPRLRCGRPRMPSGCRRARWATPRSGT